MVDILVEIEEVEETPDSHRARLHIKFFDTSETVFMSINNGDEFEFKLEELWDALAAIKTIQKSNSP